MGVYAKVEDGAVVQYPYDLYTLRQDNPNTSFPDGLSDEDYAEWGMVPVAVDPEPEFDGVYKELEAVGPTLVDGVWTVGWSVVDRDPEDVQETIEARRQGMHCTMRQARLALHQQGLLSVVEDALALIPEPDKTAIQIEWEYGNTVELNSQWVSVLQPALGLSYEQVDSLFEVALGL